jgi:Tfp pilus assembly protein PilF
MRLEIAKSLIRDKQAAAALEILNAAPGGQRQLPAVVVACRGCGQGLSLERSSDFLIQGGLWRLRTGNHSEARPSLEGALKINPAAVRALSGLNQSYLAKKEAAAGLEMVKQYASQQPQSAPLQEFLGTMLLARGDR